MSFLAVNKFTLPNSPIELRERIFYEKPVRASNEIWNRYSALPGPEAIGIGLPDGSIRKLLGHELTWEDEPVEI